jgi:molybdopterin-guanine dinucleotide biosynthesis protein A
MNLNNDITAFVIAGGKSKRFGSDKLLYEFRGRPVIKHVVDSLAGVFSEIVIIADDIDKFGFLGLQVHADIIKGIGPVGGIYTALSISKTGKIFCFAGDMPNLDPLFIRFMIDLPGDYDVIVPYTGNNYYEALHAIYSKNCLQLLKDNISKGDYKIINMFNSCHTRRIDRAEIEKHSGNKELFKNINYIEDI